MSNVWKAETSRLRIFKEFVLGTEAVRDELPAKAKPLKHVSCAGVMSGPDVPFQHIDVALLTQLKIYLKAQRGVSNRTIASYLMTIQTIFSQAIKEGLLDKKHYPFGKDKIKIPKSLKIGLTKEEVENLEAAVLPKPAHAEVRDLWLISFYFAGIRAADVLQLRWEDFRDGRLYYVMNKNDKPVSLKVPGKAHAILEHYRVSNQQPGNFVFSYMNGFEDVEDPFTLKKRIAAVVKQCDRLLKLNVAPAAGITRPLSLHIARHTFATLAGDKVPIQMLQKLYRHSDIKTTIGYQSAFIHKDADDALDAVLRS